MPLGPVVIDGQLVPRQRLEFTGQPYAIHHLDAHPRPGSPSSGLQADGGRITGVVCGASVEYSVEHAGNKVTVRGVVDNQHSVQLEIVEQLGFHTITGNLAYREVNLMLFGDRLRGYVGRCPYDLAASGDQLQQTVRANGYDMQLQINGLQALWQLPAADQAALVPLVVECLTEKVFANLSHEHPPAMGFGGVATSEPQGTLRFGSAGWRDCGTNSTRR